MTKHQPILGYRKNGAPIYLIMGGAPTRLDEVDERLVAVRTELLAIEEIAEPNADDVTRQDALLVEFEELETERAPLAERQERIDRVRAASLNPANVERGFSAPEVIIKKDAFENLEAVRSGYVSDADLRARAATAIEEMRGSDEFKQGAQHRMDTAVDPEGVARHALLTGSPAYRSAFEKILKYPETFHGMLDAEESQAVRTALSTSVGAGGYAIPFLLDPTVILTNGGVANPFRAISNIKQGTSNKWQGLTSAGVTAEWKAEGAAAADASPTFGQPAITAYLADAYVFGSYEVFQDTNLASDLPNLIADAKDQLESNAFAIGSGSGAPFGVVTSVTAVTASRVAPTTGGTFTTASRADVDKVIEAVPPRHRSSSSWISNFSTYGIIRRMDTAGGGSFWANLGAGQPQQLLGLPIYEASAVTSTVATGTNILLAGNFQNYVIYDRIGMSLEYIPNVIDQATGRPSGQRGWFATWRVGGDVVNPGAFRVLKL